MISRVADHCFWFGRYLERTESSARMLLATLGLALDGELGARQCWLPAVIVAGEEAEFRKKLGAAAADDGELVQRYLTWDDENLVCIRRSVAAARDNARSIREVVSEEAWETINGLHLWLGTDEARSLYADHRYGFYRNLRQVTQLCLGLLRSTMLHDTPLDFIWLGVLLERVGQTARILDVHHHALTHVPERQLLVEDALWLSLLRACAGFEPFMKCHGGRVDGHSVAAFLILEPRFPRSVRYCVRSAYERLCQIRPPGEAALPGGASLERLRALDLRLAGETTRTLAAAGIHEVLTYIVDAASEVCTLLGEELLGVPAVPQSEPAAQSQG